MAVVVIGGNNQYEIMEKRDRLVDGLNAVRGSLKSGFLPGGGVALLRASQLLDYIEVDNFDQHCGIRILKKAL